MKKSLFHLNYKYFCLIFFSLSGVNFVNAQNAIKINTYNNSLTFFQWGTNISTDRVSLGPASFPPQAKFHVKAVSTDKGAFKAIMFPPIGNDSIGSVENCVLKGSLYYGIYQTGTDEGRNYFRNDIVPNLVEI